MSHVTQDHYRSQNASAAKKLSLQYCTTLLITVQI